MITIAVFKPSLTLLFYSRGIDSTFVFLFSGESTQEAQPFHHRDADRHHPSLHRMPRGGGIHLSLRDGALRQVKLKYFLGSFCPKK